MSGNRARISSLHGLRVTGRHHPEVLRLKAINAVVDAALSGEAPLPRSRSFAEAIELAECVRVRAARRLRCTPAPEHMRLLGARDLLMQAAYAALAPTGAACAWCDASRGTDGAPSRAGLSVLLRDPGGMRCMRRALAIATTDVFNAEIAALETALRLARRYRIRRLRVHTDCMALVRLWHSRRADPRLARLRVLTTRFKRLELRAIPRLHNQPADALARQALGQAGGDRSSHHLHHS